MASKALPVGTCDESYLPRLVFQPPPGIRNDAHKDFHKMRLDKHHYQRSYMLCRGSGGSPKDCARRIAADTFITPQNPAASLGGDTPPLRRKASRLTDGHRVIVALDLTT
eukprot:Selendium_serpulae@DN3461_c0_g1_i4.p2